MASETENVPKKVKTNKKKQGIVSFEEEVISKEKATEVLSKIPKFEVVSDNKLEKSHKNKQSTNQEQKKSKKQKRKHESENGDVNVENFDESFENEGQTFAMGENQEGEAKSKKKQKVKREKTLEVEDIQDKKGKNNKSVETGEEVVTEENSGNPSNTKESKRAKKRKKHLELAVAKKLKATLVTQENVLNYLSTWKHSRSDWKFEKLKQIWLSRNFFESAKIPDEFWETTIAYFSESRGFIRKLILREALKIVEQEDKADEKNTDEEYQSKLKRARDIVQSLQE